MDSGDKVDTTSPMGRAFFQIAGVFAELERSMINARTKAGTEPVYSGTSLGTEPVYSGTSLGTEPVYSGTSSGIEKAKREGAKFGPPIGSKNNNTDYKYERIKIFLQAKKSYNWISKELSVSKETIAKIKKI